MLKLVVPAHDAHIIDGQRRKTAGWSGWLATSMLRTARPDAVRTPGQFGEPEIPWQEHTWRRRPPARPPSGASPARHHPTKKHTRTDSKTAGVGFVRDNRERTGQGPRTGLIHRTRKLSHLALYLPHLLLSLTHSPAPCEAVAPGTSFQGRDYRGACGHTC